MIGKRKKQRAYEVVIKPNRSWFYIDWRGLLRYRDLLLFLVRRDFIAMYKQTILGPAWYVIQPLAMTLVFTVIFGKVAKISTDGIPPMLFYLCGLVIWRYFSLCVNKTSATFVTNAKLFGKVYFPRLVSPLSVIISNLIAFAIQLITFFGFFIYFKFFTEAASIIKPNMFILILPLLLLQTAALSLGVGLWVSALTAKYRDFQFLMTFLTQFWMYATPIIYPLSVIPEKWRFIMALNPMASIVEAFKYAFLGSGTVNLQYLMVSAGMTVIILLSGLFLFNKVERTFVDTV